jgi:hypothetical protein
MTVFELLPLTYATAGFSAGWGARSPLAGLVVGVPIGLGVGLLPSLLLKVLPERKYYRETSTPVILLILLGIPLGSLIATVLLTCFVVLVTWGR